MVEIERTFAPETVKQIQVQLAVGDLKVGGAAIDQIALRARIHSGDAADLEIVQSNGSLTIRHREVVMHRIQPVDVFLVLPATATIDLTAILAKGDASVEQVNSPLRVETGKGDVSVVGGQGNLRVQTGKGDVRVDDRQGTLWVSSGKGDVSINRLTGALRVQSGLGDVSLTDWRGPADEAADNQIELGAGDVRVRGVQAQRLAIRSGRGTYTLSDAAVGMLQVETAKGDVTLAGDPGVGQWSVTAAKGDITVRLPATARARVEMATRRGSIQSDLPQVRVGRPGPASQVGGGRSIGVTGDEPRANVRLETIVGDIRVFCGGAAPEAPASVTISKERPAQPGPVVAAEPVTSGGRPGPKTALEVLESLARKEISVDEAEALLRSLETS